VSYFHMAAVVSRYGEHQPNPYLLPISVDGLIVVASVSLVELAGRVRAARDVSAVVHCAGAPTAGSQVIPAVEAASAVALLERAGDNGHAGDAPAATGAHPATAPPPVEPADADREDEPEEEGDGNIDPELAALLPAARAAREALRRAGRNLTRDSLAAHLRRDGHTIRTSRVSALLNLLRNDEPATVNGRRGSSPT
jgi:ribosomal protein L12E/L44/L45/RPP1/RPP2